MEKKLNTLILVNILLVIAMVASFVKLTALEHEIDNVRASCSSEGRILRNEVGNIYDNVDRQLKKEASLLSGSEVSFGELNTEDHTMAVSLSVVPKVITDDMAVQVSVNGRTAELTKNGTAYAGTIPVDLFTREDQLLLTITTAAGTQTEYIQGLYLDYKWAEYIPSLYDCQLSGRSTFGEGTYTLEGSLDINSSPAANTPGTFFEKYVLVTAVNGEEMEREDITQEVLNHPNYSSGTYYRDGYKKTYALAEGDALTIHLEATDSLGYVHRRLVHAWQEPDDGIWESSRWDEEIYDSKGSLLYGSSGYGS